MKCPQCKAVMQRVKRGDVTVDTCGLCYGIWLDKGELEKIVSYKNSAPGTAVDKLQSLLNKERTVLKTEEKRACPSCALNMDKISFNTPEAVIADRCPRCEGMWFDKGEMIAVTDSVDRGSGAESPGKPQSSLFSSFIVLFLSGLVLIGLIIWALQSLNK